MLTPNFEVLQDSGTVTVIIKAPFIKLSETEIFVEDHDFKFHSKPYFLRLNLPGKVIDDESCAVKYNSDTGYLEVRMKKKTDGEHFEGLDMLTKLLLPRGVTSADRPKIEVIDGDEEAEDVDDDFDWQIEQELPEKVSVFTKTKYGFACQRSAVISTLQGHLTDLFDLEDADSKSPRDIRAERLQNELQKFDSDYYLADLYDDEVIQNILKFTPNWTTYKDETEVAFNENERQQLLNFPNRTYVLDKSETQIALLGLVDIILCYAYNFRTTEGDNTVESAWTIRKLSSTLCWLDTFANLKDALVSFIRRSLSYPLYRNMQLSLVIINDVASLFKLGPKMILKCLLDTHALLNSSDPHYILNDLFLTDYCVWIQSIKSTVLKDIAENISKISIDKSDIGLDLEKIETNSSNYETIEQSLSTLNLNDHDSDDDSSDSATSTCSDSSSDGETSEESSTESETDSDDSDGSNIGEVSENIYLNMTEK